MPSSSEPGGGRHSRRTKVLDVTPEGEGRWWFRSTLSDESFGGRYEQAADHIPVHDFSVEGRVEGIDLRLVELTLDAEEHPFAGCPLVLPAAQRLVGTSLASGWRRAVLGSLRGAAGCTHVTTLLLGLSEVITLVYFQRMNERVPYGPSTRESGEWIAGTIGFAPGLRGACHVLVPGGEVVTQAELFAHKAGSVSGPTGERATQPPR